ncbi:hypothetical protein IG631_22287 [Alternaria alternata]|nr:hypothetical protein IG631_22287 [Alternaria alternata]
MFALGTRLLGNGVQLVHDGQLTSLRTWSELQHYRARCSPELVSIFKSVQRDCLEAQQKIHGNHGRTRCGFNHHSMGAEKPFRLVTCIIHGLLSLRILPAIITPPSCGFALRGCKSDARRPVSHPSLHSVRILCVVTVLRWRSNKQSKLAATAEYVRHVGKVIHPLTLAMVVITASHLHRSEWLRCYARQVTDEPPQTSR